MSLREILTKIVEDDQQIVLNDGQQDWDADTLLQSLSEPRLKTPAHMQSGMYIAEIDPGGYLGRVMFRIKPKDQ